MENKKDQYDAAILRVILIVFSIIIALIMLFVVSAIEESYSRAEQEQHWRKQQQAEHNSAAAPYITKDIRREYLRLYRQYYLRNTGSSTGSCIPHNTSSAKLFRVPCIGRSFHKPRC